MALKISYWTASRTNPNVPGAVISTESLTLSGTHAQSGTTPANAVFVCLDATENAAFDYSSSNPTAVAGATGTSAYIPANGNRWMDAAAGFKVSGIQAT